MPVAILNRQKLQQLAESRLAEAKVLLDAGYFTGAYYLAGLGIECALKASLAKAVQQYDFPDKDFVINVYRHELGNLIKLDAALSAELQRDVTTNADLRSNWQTVQSWKHDSRYDSVTELQARTLFEAATEAGNGMTEWIRRRW